MHFKPFVQVEADASSNLLYLQERLDQGNVYITLELFRAELARIWSNARHYNGEETIFAKAANAMERFTEQHFLSTLHYRKA